MSDKGFVVWNELCEHQQYKVRHGPFKDKIVRVGRLYEPWGGNPGLAEMEILTDEGEWLGLTTIPSDDELRECDLLIPLWDVMFYECDRAYGGGEEGGWWYDCGEQIKPLRLRLVNETEAYKLCRRANNLLNHLRPPDVQISSVNYMGGHFEAQVHPSGLAPTHYPQYRPHYE